MRGVKAGEKCSESLLRAGLRGFSADRRPAVLKRSRQSCYVRSDMVRPPRHGTRLRGMREWLALGALSAVAASSWAATSLAREAKPDNPGAERSASTTDGSGSSDHLVGLAVRRTRLDNGLRVVLSRSTSLPTVAICVSYGVGARDDVGRQGGFALSLQRLMFRGSEHVGAGQHVAWIHEIGGDFSAETTSDRTRFIDVLPANALALGLWLEADRMKSLALSTDALTEERRQVQEQAHTFRLEPYALGQRQLRALVFQDYPPYARDPLGGPEDLSEPIEASGLARWDSAELSPDPPDLPPTQAELDRLRRFHDEHYAPNNAVLSLAGNFEIVQALNLIHQYFSDAREVLLASAPDGAPSEQNEPRRATLRDPSAATPALLHGWAVPAWRSHEHYALEVAKVILGAGQSSRLYQQLVLEKELARQVEVWTDEHVGPDLFGVRSILTDSADPDLVSRITLGQIASLGRFGPTANELTRAKTRIRSSFFIRLDGNPARASMLGDFELLFHDAELAKTELDQYLSVSREDVQQVVAHYLRSGRRSEVLILPKRTHLPAPGRPSAAPPDPPARPEPTDSKPR